MTNINSNKKEVQTFKVYQLSNANLKKNPNARKGNFRISRTDGGCNQRTHAHTFKKTDYIEWFTDIDHPKHGPVVEDDWGYHPIHSSEYDSFKDCALKYDEDPDDFEVVHLIYQDGLRTGLHHRYYKIALFNITDNKIYLRNFQKKEEVSDLKMGGPSKTTQSIHKDYYTNWSNLDADRPFWEVLKNKLDSYKKKSFNIELYADGEEKEFDIEDVDEVNGVLSNDSSTIKVCSERHKLCEKVNNHTDDILMTPPSSTHDSVAIPSHDSNNTGISEQHNSTNNSILDTSDTTQSIKQWLININPALAHYSEGLIEYGWDNIGMIHIDDVDEACQYVKMKKPHFRKINEAVKLL